MVWMGCSAQPSICGGNAVLCFTLVPSPILNVFQKWGVSWVPLSEIIDKGTPWIFLNLYKIQFSLFFRPITNFDRNKMGWFSQPIRNNPNLIVLPSRTRKNLNEHHIVIFPHKRVYRYIFSKASRSLMSNLNFFYNFDIWRQILLYPSANNSANRSLIGHDISLWHPD